MKPRLRNGERRPQEILYDQDETLWLDVDDRDEIIWHPAFLDFAKLLRISASTLLAVHP